MINCIMLCLILWSHDIILCQVTVICLTHDGTQLSRNNHMTINGSNIALFTHTTYFNPDWNPD